MTERGQRNKEPHISVSFAVLPVEAVYMELESLCRPDVTPSLGPAACPACSPLGRLLHMVRDVDCFPFCWLLIFIGVFPSLSFFLCSHLRL